MLGGSGARPPEAKFGGLMLGEHRYVASARDNSGSHSPGRGQFSITRIYVTGEMKFNDKVKGKIVLDGNHSGGSGNSVFLKNAFGEYAFFKYAKLQAGLIPTPWIGYEERIWGHRFVQKVQPDLEGVLHSADLGVGLMGELPAGPEPAGWRPTPTRPTSPTRTSSARNSRSSFDQPRPELQN